MTKILNPQPHPGFRILHWLQNANFESQVRSKGFTLLETIVALAVILGTLAGPVTLVTRGLVSSSGAKNRLIALNLAQEGIELMRLARDNNVLCAKFKSGWKWDYDPGTTVDLKNETREVDVTDLVALKDTNCSTIVSPHLQASANRKLNLNPSTGLYGYGNGAASLFTRTLVIVTPPTAPDADLLQSDQMDVTATVSWSERGSSRTVELKERLYNWR